MPVVWCPQCQLPLTPEECATGCCALCGAALSTIPPSATDTALSSEVKPYEVPPSLLGRWEVWAAIGLLLFLFLSAGVVIATWPEHPGEVNSQQVNNDYKKDNENLHTSNDEEPAETVVMGPPEELKGIPPFIGPPDELKPPPVVVVKRPEFVGPPDNLKRPVVVNPRPIFVGPPDNLKRTNAVTETVLNDPDGEYVVTALLNGKSLKLTGKVKRLRISGQISGRATLDAAQLEAQEIIVEQPILNDSIVKLNAPHGSVEVRGQIIGRVNLSIEAPQGTVTFKANAPVLNESKLAITAGRVDFQERIQGNVQVDATLSAGGRLKYKEIINGSKVRYKKANPKDPDLDILPGDVASQGELRPAADAIGKRMALVGPPDDLRPPLRAAQNPRVNDNETHLDDPDGEFVVDKLINGKTLKLTGKVKRLKIGQVNGKSTLDASQLEAKEIVVLQGIFNDSTVKLNAPNGSVEFRGQLNGRVKVFIIAPKGTVTFKANAQITNEAKVTVTAGSIECNELIHGSNTQLTATLTNGGYLCLKEVANGSKVQVKKANPNDPELKIEPGIIRDQAELKKSN